MPELPEVEVCRRNLARWSAGRIVAGVHLEDPGAVRPRPGTRPTVWPEAGARVGALVGRAAGPLARRGKRLAWWFGDLGLLLHLGMSGRWVRREADESPRWGRFGLTLDDGATLWLIDPRRFGCVVPMAGNLLAGALVERLGPDALDAPPRGSELAARLRSRRPVKVALMDQERLAGVGNIHAVEALHRAGIAPATLADALDDVAWARLAAAIPSQLAAAVAETEAEEVAYVSDGSHVENPFAVYGREGESCRACGARIARSVIAGRSTWWCPSCQPA